MTDQQENQLHVILSDFIPLMDGDRIQGISPEAKRLTRQEVLDQLLADKELFAQTDASLVSWQDENIQLLKAISDEEFQAIRDEKILLTELQIGQSLFEPLSENQLEELKKKLTPEKERTSESQTQASEKVEQNPSLWNKILKTFG
ncbi:hypothetical protein KB565_07430 [Streptococcus canis]|uniref:hypothetical protein n=1 Tax=Streptococcus canis TaxID=1329 RepID=UPI00294A2767|nr:hypothetical protein [Streptococcus canis]MDV6001636.1 hypothetical protein [Streptococcus canis]